MEHVRLKVLKAVTIKSTIIWDHTPCSLVIYKRFGGTYWLHLQGCTYWAKQAWLLDLLVDPGNGGSMFFRTVSKLLPDYTVYCSRMEYIFLVSLFVSLTTEERLYSNVEWESQKYCINRNMATAQNIISTWLLSVWQRTLSYIRMENPRKTMKSLRQELSQDSN
jgi:hypothetical protein